MPSKADGTPTTEIAQLGNLDLGELRDLWRQLLGSPPHFASTEMTRLWLAWELQARARGGYDPATRRRLRQLGNSTGNDAVPKSASFAALKPGTVLTREWGGVTHRVMVLGEGFAWAGKNYRSLSEIANRISGSRWSGPRFFGLRKRDRP